ncbi:MAG: HAD family hydrolase [Candidatus Woesearchaeota archaeon]
MIKAIIFDLWGTLFESDATTLPFEEFATKLGRTYRNPEFYTVFSETFMAHPITHIEQTMHEFTKNIGVDVNEGLIHELCEIFKKNGTVRKYAFPETIAVLQELKKRYKIAILSNTTNISMKQIFEKFPLYELVDEIILSYEVGMQKPDPRIYEIALEKLSVSKDEVIMVGDSLRLDVQSAEDFGIKGILIDRKNKNSDYPNRITSLTELPKLLEQM